MKIPKILTTFGLASGLAISTSLVSHISPVSACPSLFNPFCTPPTPQRKSETHDFFKVKNDSNFTVHFAYTEYKPSWSDQNMMFPAEWISSGWYTINPGETRSVYETRRKGSKIYVRLQSANGRVVVPNNHTNMTDFCSSQSRYNSRVGVNGHNLSIQIGDAPSRGGANSSCSEIGGEMNTFWQLPANTTFTVQ